MPIGILAEIAVQEMAVPTTNKVELLFWEDGAFNWWDPSVDGPQAVITGLLTEWLNTINLNPTNAGNEPQIRMFPNSADGDSVGTTYVDDGWIIEFPSRVGASSFTSLLWQGAPVLAGTANGWTLTHGGWDFTSTSNSGYGAPDGTYITQNSRYVSSYKALSILITSSVDDGKEFLSMVLRAGDRTPYSSGSNASEVSLLIFKDQHGEWVFCEDLTSTRCGSLFRDHQSGQYYDAYQAMPYTESNSTANQVLSPMYIIHEGEDYNIPGQKLWFAANEYLYLPSYVPSDDGIIYGKIADSPSEAFIGTTFASGRQPIVRYSVA